MPRYFDDASLDFLRKLARHNARPWFHAHKPQYEAHVREPFMRLLGDLQPVLAGISAHYRSEPRGMGGSLLRIQRDTRFANDKTPYKTWQGAKLFHARNKQVATPQFYLHLEPGVSLIAAGLWHPDAPVLRRLRHFIVDNPGGWQAATQAPAFRKRFVLDDSEMLVRMPRGFPPDSPHANDLRRRNLVAIRMYTDATMTGTRLLSTIDADLQALAPFVDYLCAGLDLEF